MVLVGGSRRADIQAQIDSDKESGPFSAYCRFGCKDTSGFRLLLAECWSTDDMLDIEDTHADTRHGEKEIVSDRQKA